ncbi:MAG: hypothetical protein QNJ64_10540 [Crocosphaera sp.]|nr:hypothetical protein [Crocosphaera sp.]
MTEQQEQITYPNLPLAVYRELAAHLRQVEGVKIELVPQKSPKFDYAQSQIDHLVMGYPMTILPQEKQRIEAILDYYAQVHTTYERKVLEP